MSYHAEILADSIANDVRLTTVMATFPRFILAEINTHRVFSRNSASSRAIPTERLIERVMDNPFVPATFNKRVKGMGVGSPLDESQQAEARHRWLRAAKHATTVMAWRQHGGDDASCWCCSAMAAWSRRCTSAPCCASPVLRAGIGTPVAVADAPSVAVRRRRSAMRRLTPSFYARHRDR